MYEFLHNVDIFKALANGHRLKIYDIQGRFIRNLLDNTMYQGRHVVSWDGRNNEGRQVSVGIYFFVLQTAEFKNVKKMTLIR